MSLLACPVTIGADLHSYNLTLGEWALKRNVIFGYTVCSCHKLIIVSEEYFSLLYGKASLRAAWLLSCLYLLLLYSQNSSEDILNIGISNCVYYGPFKHFPELFELPNSGMETIFWRFEVFWLSCWLHTVAY